MMSLLLKAFALTAAALATSMANAATYHCKSLSGDAGGQVQLTTGGQVQVTLSLIKNGFTVGRLDFSAPPKTVIQPNLAGTKVPFLKYFDSINAGTVVVSSTLYVESSLFSRTSRTGLVIFQQQEVEQYLCQLATN
jgi:hypothetical protein